MIHGEEVDMNGFYSYKLEHLEFYMFIKIF